MPNIPCLPISYTAAREILERMTGPVAEKWNGGLNVTYRYGPGLIDGMTTTIDVHSHFENRHVSLHSGQRKQLSGQFKMLLVTSMGQKNRISTLFWEITTMLGSMAQWTLTPELRLSRKWRVLLDRLYNKQDGGLVRAIIGLMRIYIYSEDYHVCQLGC